MKIILLSGFLGAGKTSVLVQLAGYLATLPLRKGSQISAIQTLDESPVQAKTRVAILENEIGQVSVDGTLLSGMTASDEGSFESRFELRELFSGCVCCSLTGEMLDTVQELQAAIQPEWLIIEATGLAVPKQAAAVLREGLTDLDGLLTVVLIDTARFLVLEKVSPLVLEQAKTADVLLLNKVDLVSDAVKEQVLKKLCVLNETALVLEVVASEPIACACFMEMIERV